MAAGKGGGRRTERGKGMEKESGDGTREGRRDHEDQEKGWEEYSQAEIRGAHEPNFPVSLVCDKRTNTKSRFFCGALCHSESVLSFKYTLSRGTQHQSSNINILVFYVYGSDFSAQ